MWIAIPVPADGRSAAAGRDQPLPEPWDLAGLLFRWLLLA
ncbi:MAG: hypothetical protein FD152_1659 [Xanthobacteraceae bacterium]|nr:MAG: hypothetical protein FD152_1659 [Xanthobacteraceae bacterium]